MKHPTENLRPNVAAIIMRGDQRVLIGQRADARNVWQFPQGGIDHGECPMRAIQREVFEEVGIHGDILRILTWKGEYAYRFPHGHRKDGIWTGQLQTYFLCEFLGGDADIRLEKHKREFQTVRWIQPAEYRLSWLPKFKRPVYRDVFQDFFKLEIAK